MTKTGILLAAIVLLAPLSCRNRGEALSQEEYSEESIEDIVELTPAQMSAVGITVGPVERRTLSETVQTSGSLKLSPQSQAEVTSLVNGKVRRILAKQGQSVRAGETLALVENTEIVSLQKDYLIATRQAELSASAFEREKELREKGAGVEKNLQQAEAQCRMDESTAQGIRQQLIQIGLSPENAANGQFSETVPVKAPISGVVGDIFISTGSWLSDGTVLMNIYDNKALHADLNVFEADIAKIVPGQKVSLRLSDQSRTNLEGKVSLITATLDPVSKSATVHVDLHGGNSSVTLLPNMFVSASILCGENPCDAVPDEAVVMKADRSYVFVKEEGNRFRKVEVVPVVKQMGYTGISFLDSSSEGKEIVTSKAFYLESILADHGEE